MNSDNILVGTSGFSYRDWLGNFYPQFCPQADFLKFYSSRFQTVEIDSTFYRIPTAETVKKWAKVTPGRFVFSAKFPQTVTHEGDLESRLGSLRAFLKAMDNLGPKLGPLLLQFPYSFKPDSKDMLLALIDALPENGLFAVELRNRKWLEEEDLFDRLSEKGIAFCLIDHPWMPRIDMKTGSFQYIRMLGDRKKIENDFSYVRFDREQELQWWSRMITEYARSGVNCFVYFNNHYSGHAPTTADKLRAMINQGG